MHLVRYPPAAENDHAVCAGDRFGAVGYDDARQTEAADGFVHAVFAAKIEVSGGLVEVSAS